MRETGLNLNFTHSFYFKKRSVLLEKNLIIKEQKLKKILVMTCMKLNVHCPLDKAI